jgi:hypothetical protein
MLYNSFCAGCFIVVVCLFATAYAGNYFLNGSSLSITSIVVNPTKKHSSWVSKIFGQDSLFWERGNKRYFFDSDSQVHRTPAEAYHMRKTMQRSLNFLPSYAFQTQCSVEFAGFVAVEVGVHPFMLSFRHEVPSAGYAEITVNNVWWPCVYRATYDNWRDGERAEFVNLSGMYWPIYIYCYPKIPKLSKFDNKHKTLSQRESAIAANDLTGCLLMRKELFAANIAPPTNTLNPMFATIALTTHGGSEEFLYARVKVPPFPAVNNGTVVSSKRRYSSLQANQYKMQTAATSAATLAARAAASALAAGTAGSAGSSTVATAAATSGVVVAPNPHGIAVCTCLPYRTNVPGKSDVVGAVFHHWARYYARLGVQMLVYDRGGVREKYLLQRNKTASYSDGFLNVTFSPKLSGGGLSRGGYVLVNSSNAAALGMKERNVHMLRIREHLTYFNYTMLELLDRKGRVPVYDNREGVTDDLVILDNDHTYTLSQCRMEAKARFGIETVIVVDFDEFLYCPAGGTEPAKQFDFQRKYFASLRRQGYDQVTFLQRTLANKTSDTPFKCVRKMRNEWKRNPAGQASIFDCFAPVRYFLEDFAPKSVHLTLNCPVTTDHHACPLHDYPRLYDCAGRSFASEECSFIHISLRDSDYEKEGMENYPLKEYEKQTCELKKLINYIDEE